MRCRLFSFVTGYRNPGPFDGQGQLECPLSYNTSRDSRVLRSAPRTGYGAMSLVFPDAELTEAETQMKAFLARSGAITALGLVLLAGSVAQEPGTEAPARPCLEAPEFAQFDFWLGNWDVHLEDGRKAGINTIEKEQGGCVLVERWTSSGGGTGMSLNYFEPENRQWVQIWVGADGSLIDIRGGLQDDGSMQLDGFIQNVGQEGRNAFRGRWTLLADGRVTQHFEESTDDGKTWKDSFLGFYTRQTAAEK